MKILWHSNSPGVQSGYGGQTDIFARQIKNAGHDLMISAFYGLYGQRINVNGVMIMPGSRHSYGDDILGDHVERLKPDVCITLIDVWVFSDDTIKRSKMTPWTPVDHDPIPPAVLVNLNRCEHVWAMSRFGEIMMKNAGVKAQIHYVPHGVETNVYRPMNRQEARKPFNFKDDQFVVVSVAANKGFPSRKNLPALLKAWGKFAADHPDAVLWLHSDASGTYSGLNLHDMARFYGCNPAQVKFPNEYDLDMGMYTPTNMNALYNAADVFLLPSAGEGFGIPAIEAQAAGLPVILSDFSAQSELCGAGWLIAVDRFDDLDYTLQNSEQAHIRPSLIVEALEKAYAARGDQKLRDQARDFAMQYDAGTVWREYMLPALEHQTGITQERAARTAARLALRESQKEAEKVLA